MEIKRFLAVAAALTLLAACGGSSGGGGTATSTETKVAASAAAERTVGAPGQAVLQTLAGQVGAMIVKADPDKASGDPIAVQIACDEGGTIDVTGPVTYTCEELAGATNCAVSNSTLTLAFSNCVKNVTLSPAGRSSA